MSFWDRFQSGYSSFINRITNVEWVLRFMDKIGVASSSNDGFMSADDKGNLDSVLDGSILVPKATNASSANQLQSFVNDNFTSGGHYVKAIRSADGWSTRLYTCYNGDVAASTAVVVGSADYASDAGHANYTETLHSPGVAWISARSDGYGPRLYTMDSPNGTPTSNNIRVSYADSAGSASTASGASYANQLQAFVNDNFTSGDHFIKAIRDPDNWWMRLKTCYNGGVATTNNVRVAYSDSTGSFPHSHSLSDITNGQMKDFGNITTKNEYRISLDELANISFIRIRFTAPDEGHTNALIITRPPGGGIEALAAYCSQWDAGGTSGNYIHTLRNWTESDWVINFGTDHNEWGSYGALNAMIMRGWWI
jgi:hypothetical protein